MKYEYNNFIGIFDSGLGGISVLNKCLNLMPNENYVYFADSSNLPYGKKDKSQLIQIGTNILSNFKKHNAKQVIIACSTMSTNCINIFRDSFKTIDIVGTFPNFDYIFVPSLVIRNDSISYDAEKKLEIKRERLKILVIATTATCKSKYLAEKAKSYKKLIDVYLEPADFIVTAVENNALNSFDFNNSLSHLLKEYHDVDYLVLGCTHFEFAVDQIKQCINSNAKIVSGYEVAANDSYRYLKNNNLLNNSNNNPTLTIIDSKINDDKKLKFKNLIKDSDKIFKNIVFKNEF